MAAAFGCSLGEFDASTAFEKLGRLIGASASAGFGTHYHKQTSAWEAELQILGSLSSELTASMPESRDWRLLLEYEIPRRDKRPDVVLLANDLVFVIEFKIGQESFLGVDEWQAYSYALDLRDFHAESKGRNIIPVLVATAAGVNPELERSWKENNVKRFVSPVLKTNAVSLATCVGDSYRATTHARSARIDADAWENSAYRPTPTIIEAAVSLFAGHRVADISHAFASNLDVTTGAVVDAIRAAAKDRRRTICFVTGIPGAGKTLTGLNAVHDPSLRDGDRPPAIFLSGNGPLVKIVREALVREKQRRGMLRTDAARLVSTFIANVHGFLVHYGIKNTSQPPAEHAIVFDEAQRAWTADAVMKRHEVHESEPGLILQIMERAAEWCAVVALVGGGQEIHVGEAGLEEWGRSLSSRPERWRILASPELLRGDASAAHHRLFESAPASHLEVVPAPELHLDVSVRSPRARLLGIWVNEVLSHQTMHCHVAEDQGEFPLVMTRDLATARRWLMACSDASQRAGLLASSGALRLRAYGIEVSSGFRQGYPYADWFLAGYDDTRSSTRLEVAATEFECQGLEIDWAGVCWGDDLVIDPARSTWVCRKFRGTKWQRVNQAAQRQYVLNKYRVLLTRARRGMVIWVPPGDPKDPTRDYRLLDATADYLQRSGVSLL